MRKREADPAANAEYIARYRRENPEQYAKHRAAIRAEHRAFRRLAALHHEEYERLQDAERIIEGLPPVHATKRGRPAARSDGAEEAT